MDLRPTVMWNNLTRAWFTPSNSIHICFSQLLVTCISVCETFFQAKGQWQTSSCLSLKISRPSLNVLNFYVRATHFCAYFFLYICEGFFSHWKLGINSYLLALITKVLSTWTNCPQYTLYMFIISNTPLTVSRSIHTLCAQKHGVGKLVSSCLRWC